MAIERHRQGSTVVLALTGSFDAAAPEFAQTLLDAVREDDFDVILDLSRVAEFRATKPLLAAERQRRDQGGLRRLAIVAAPGTATFERLTFSGMGKQIPIFPTIDDVTGAWETDGFPA